MEKEGEQKTIGFNCFPSSLLTYSFTFSLSHSLSLTHLFFLVLSTKKIKKLEQELPRVAIYMKHFHCCEYFFSLFFFCFFASLTELLFSVFFHSIIWEADLFKIQATMVLHLSFSILNTGFLLFFFFTLIFCNQFYNQFETLTFFWIERKLNLFFVFDKIT